MMYSASNEALNITSSGFTEYDAVDAVLNRIGQEKDGDSGTIIYNVQRG